MGLLVAMIINLLFLRDLIVNARRSRRTQYSSKDASPTILRFWYHLSLYRKQSSKSGI